MRNSQLRSGQTPRLAGAAASAGFRTVDLVTLSTDGHHTVARASGVLHRYPRTVEISMSAAHTLVAAGAPLRVVRRTGGGSA